MLSAVRMVARVAPARACVAAAMPSRFYAVKAPEGLKYAKSHEWIKVSNGIGTVGVSSYAAEALGDVVFVDLPAVGKTVAAGGEAAVVESVKAVGDVYSPVSGEIVEANEGLKEEPALINSSPYEKGWMFKVKLSNAKELDSLLNAEDYAKHCASEHH